MIESSLVTVKEQKGYAEEIIIIDKLDIMLKYSLSGSLDDIKTAICERTGCNVDLDNTPWKLNPALSESVKLLMNRHCVNYSMTAWDENKKRHIVVNMRVGDNWFITGFEEVDGTFYNWEHLLTTREIYEILKNIMTEEE